MNTLNWIAGWSLILTGLIVGAGIGLFFHRDDFAGGYQSWRRRLLRLGHIACVALGMLNLIVSLAGQASVWLVAGGVLMPAVCFLAAWRKPFRHLFFVPVTCLVVGVVMMIFTFCHSELARNLKLPARMDSRDSSQARNDNIGEEPGK